MKRGICMKCVREKTDLPRLKRFAIALLQMDIGKTELSPLVVQHPFTTSGFFAVPDGKGFVLTMLVDEPENQKVWRKQVTEEIERREDAFGVYLMITKPYLLAFLKYAEPYLSKDDFAKILADAWIRCEAPNNDPNLSKRNLVALFKNADPQVLMDESEYSQYRTLDDVVTVYRGVTEHNANNVKALSWTLNRETAEWFAHRFDEDGDVYSAQIQKKHILALFNGRNESEVIVDPKHLQDITLVQNIEMELSL